MFLFLNQLYESCVILKSCTIFYCFANQLHESRMIINRHRCCKRWINGAIKLTERHIVGTVPRFKIKQCEAWLITSKVCSSLCSFTMLEKVRFCSMITWNTICGRESFVGCMRAIRPPPKHTVHVWIFHIYYDWSYYFFRIPTLFNSLIFQ